MADLLDIVPATAIETVKIDDMEITVRGLRAPAMATIISRFPQLGTILTDGANLEAKLIAHCGLAVPPVIAAGCGHLGEDKYERAAAELVIEDQLKLVAAILRLTFPNGFNSFVEAMTALMSGAGEGVKPVKVRLKKSPSPSPLSSDAASLQTTQ